MQSHLAHRSLDMGLDLFFQSRALICDLPAQDAKREVPQKEVVLAGRN